MLTINTAQAADSTTVYDAIPSSLPPNMASIGFQATKTAEFGDYIHLGGTNRILNTVTVTMSDWALNSTYPSMNAAGWTHPITLNIYNAVPGTPLNTKGSLIGTVTQTFTIPWRPEGDQSCPILYGVNGWKVGENCYNGYAFNITFDLSGLNVTMPDDVIVGVAYNTQSYGANPIGTAGPYNSLNVGEEGSATVGTDKNMDNVFWNTSTASNYTDAGVAGVGIFREDTAWGKPSYTLAAGTLPMQITATPFLVTNGSNGYSTIQAAIAAANPGDTIHVGAGIYKEQLNIAKGITLVGDVANPDNVVIDGENKTNLPNPGQVRIYNPTGPVIFEGFKIINGGTSPASGEYHAILTKGDYSRTIQNNKILGHGSGVDLGSDYGLWAAGGTGELIVKDNSFTNTYHGILLEQQYGATTVENNTFDALYTGTLNNTKYGGRAIEAIDYGTTDVSSLQKFSGNKFLNFKSTGIQITGGFGSKTPRKFTNVLIENNNFDFTTTDISNLNGAIYLANISAGNSDSAGGVTAAINNNYIHVPSGNGVIIKGLNGDISLDHNSIVGNSIYGVKANELLGSVINATNNWWGISTGPTTEMVSSNVSFSPWFSDEAKTTLRYTTAGSEEHPTITPDPVTITATENGDVGIVIPDDMTITGPAGWTGDFILPTVTTTTVTVSGFDTSVTSAIIVGSNDFDLTFDKAVKLTFAGQAGTLVGYYNHAGTFATITACSAGSHDQAWADDVANLAVGAACTFDSGSDLIVWTKHFSTFTTYTQTAVSHGNSSYIIPVTPAVPAKVETPDGCSTGAKFSTTTGRNCNAATPAIGKVLGAEKFNFKKFMKNGSKGNEIIELQKFLTTLGYTLTADGKFGPKTKGAVIKFQIANSLKGDGVIGALTRAVLNK